MASFNKFNWFAWDLARGVHDLSTDTIKYRLTNAAPSATMDVITCITTIATGNGWSTDVSVTFANATMIAGESTFRLTFADSTVEASGGAIGTFRYVVFYNDTPATPTDYVTDPLIGWYDYGTAVTLSAGEKFVLDFADASTGIITIS